MNYHRFDKNGNCRCGTTLKVYQKAKKTITCPRAIYRETEQSCPICKGQLLKPFMEHTHWNCDKCDLDLPTMLNVSTFLYLDVLRSLKSRKKSLDDLMSCVIKTKGDK